ERVRRLSGSRETPGRGARPASKAHCHLCALRFREFWLARYPGGRARRDGAGAPPRDHRTRLAIDRFRHDRNLHERGDRRAAAAITTWCCRRKSHSALARCSAQATSCASASLTPLRYPIPNPTAQPAATPPNMVRQIRATSSAQTIEASAERNQVIYWARTDPTTTRRACAPEGLVPAHLAALVAQPERQGGAER